MNVNKSLQIKKNHLVEQKNKLWIFQCDCLLEPLLTASNFFYYLVNLLKCICLIYKYIISSNRNTYRYKMCNLATHERLKKCAQSTIINYHSLLFGENKYLAK